MKFKKADEKLVTLWTIQPLSFWEKLKADKVIYGEENAILNGLNENDDDERFKEVSLSDYFQAHFNENIPIEKQMEFDVKDPKIESFIRNNGGGFYSSYCWLRSQMFKRADNHLKNEVLQRNAMPIFAWYCFSDKSHKPDLRFCRHYQRKGEIGVRITFQVKAEDLLLTDYGDWHCVLNNCPYIENDDDDNFDHEWDYLSSNFHLKEQSWHKIIRPNNAQRIGQIQATIFKINLENVLELDFFKGTYEQKR